MPAFNVEKYIEEAVASVSAQTFTDWELIIVDDGSTDSTAAIASRLAAADQRIRLMSMPSPSGSAYQPRKTAIMAARADIVSPLDADDCIPSYCIGLMMEQMKAEDADIVYPTMTDMATGKAITPTEDGIADSIYAGREAMKLTLDGWRINCNGGLIRRELYMQAYSEFDSTVRFVFADELLSRQLLYAARRVFISKAEYFFRRNPESVTHRRSGHLFDYIINDVEIDSFVSERYPDDREARVLAQRQLFHGIFNAYRLLNRFSFSGADRDYALELIAEAKSHVDWNFVRPHVSPRYYAILRNRLIPTAPAVRFVDFYRKLKK